MPCEYGILGREINTVVCGVITVLANPTYPQRTCVLALANPTHLGSTSPNHVLPLLFLFRKLML
jgi:hypothetical protein